MNRKLGREHPWKVLYRVYRTFHRCFPPNFGSFWQSSFREEDFYKSTNRKQELPVVAMFVNGLVSDWPILKILLL
jgi:hypothetical protein